MMNLNLYTIQNIKSIGLGLLHKNSRYFSITKAKYIYRPKQLPICLNKDLKSSPVLLKTHSFLYPNKYLWLFPQHGSKPFSKSSKDKKDSTKLNSTLYYIIAVGILAVGCTYAAVPMYRLFCQAYSYGGTVQAEENASKIESMKVDKYREISIGFNADTAASMTWNFKPQQSKIKVRPGETALAFYSAYNPTDKPVVGVSTYNVVPFEAGQYFNKIQCFCFDEQILNPKEEVSMPVFFYIDPEFTEDPKMEYVDYISLSYTFFEVKEGFKWPIQMYGKS